MGGDAPINASGEVSEKTFNLQVDGTEEQHQEVLAHDEPSGVVVFGAFAAGSLIGIIVCAPAFVVFLLGAGVASLTSADSKVRLSEGNRGSPMWIYLFLVFENICIFVFSLIQR